MAFQHGVYIQELDTKILGVRTCDSALPFVVGTAPVHTVAGDTPVNEARLIFNYKEFTEVFGDVPDGEKEAQYGLSQFARIYFMLYGMSPAIIVNVMDPEVHNSSIVAEEVVFSSQKMPLVKSGVMNEVVRSEDGETTYVKGTDYSIDYPGGNITRKATGGIIKGQTVLIDYDYGDVSKVMAADVRGGTDAETGERTGLELIDEVFSRFGKVVGNILCPKWSNNLTIANAMIAKAESLNNHFKAMAIVEAPYDIVLPEDVVTFKQNFGSPHVIVCWPQVEYGSTLHKLSLHAAGLMAQTDEKNANVPFESPSNKELRINGPAKILTIQEANYLNEQGICTVFRFSTGWKFWGNRTAAFPEVTDIKDSFIPCRRMANWIENNLVLLSWQKVDDPMNKRLIETVVSTVNIWLNGLVGRSYLIGAKVYFRPEDNSLTDLANGIIRFYITYLSPPPAETIEYVLEVDVKYFNNLFGSA